MPLPLFSVKNLLSKGENSSLYMKKVGEDLSMARKDIIIHFEGKFRL